MRIKALLALLGLGIALMLVVGCNNNNNNGTVLGVVTNASTGLGQGNATVTLLRNGNVVKSVQTSNDSATLGAYTIGDVDPGGAYTLLVTSNATPPAFTDVTTNAFTVVSGINTVNVTVGSGIIGTTLSGTITNASTGLGQPNATVTLQQNGTVFETTAQTDANGRYLFTNLTPGVGFAIKVTSNATPPAFVAVTSATFPILQGANTEDLTVGSGLIGTTVSGTLGTTEADETYQLSLLQGTTVVATTTAGPAEVPTFTFTNVPIATGYTIQVKDARCGVITIFGLVDVPVGGVSGLVIFVKSAQELKDMGIPATANLAAIFNSGSGTISAAGKLSTNSNPTWLTVPTGDTAVVINPPNSAAPVNMTVPVLVGFITVIRLNGM